MPEDGSTGGVSSPVPGLKVHTLSSPESARASNASDERGLPLVLIGVFVACLMVGALYVSGAFDTQTGESADHDAQGAVHGPQENLVPTPSAKEAPENVADGPSHAGKASADMGVGQAEHIDAAIGGRKSEICSLHLLPHEVTVTRASDKTVVCTQVTECELPIFVQPEVTIDTITW